MLMVYEYRMTKVPWRPAMGCDERDKGTPGLTIACERILRVEIRHLQSAALRSMQTDMAIMGTFTTVVFFIRKEVTSSMPPGSQAPHWYLGTIFLFIFAFAFFAKNRYISVRLRNYRKQLGKHPPSGIVELGTFRWSRNLMVNLYFAFPGLDLIVQLSKIQWTHHLSAYDFGAGLLCGASAMILLVRMRRRRLSISQPPPAEPELRYESTLLSGAEPHMEQSSLQ